MLWELIGIDHTLLSCIFLCSHFWARCLMLVTYWYWLLVFCVLKAEWLRTFVYVFLIFFFQNPKKHDFLRYFGVVAHVFTNTGSKQPVYFARALTYYTQCVHDRALHFILIHCNFIIIMLFNHT